MILVKDIIIEGNPDLVRVAEPVKEPVRHKDLQTLKNMMRYLERSQNEKICKKYDLKPGVGLAAPQIDCNKRMLAILIDSEDGPIEYGIINPVILAESVQMSYLPGGEACLSIPGKKGNVLRHKKIRFTATFYDYHSGSIEKKTIQLDGYPSIVFQHEFDHLNGILFTTRVTE